ncbi:MBL fold metallo-hydrolase [Spongisporangium articulatum]|uniref:MBL fold metallo-hydrolase n=1 Tax=Spongisporangium articulatum TaxID=3362603 RepID=A0ABW8ALM4_9ACTN
MSAHIERLVTSGVFSLDGQDFDVENNVWLIGDDRSVMVVDAAHDAGAILAAVGDRDLLAVICTHGHNDHINAAMTVADNAASGPAPVYLHPDDRMLWDVVHPHSAPEPLHDDHRFDVAETQLRVLHTPGHSPGAVCLYAPALGALFSGDTLFHGGPGATGRSYSSFPTILESIRTRLLDLPPGTTVLTGHGDPTTIGAEAGDYDAWVARGH